jgi:mono/diheme cytochrome c family protein
VASQNQESHNDSMANFTGVVLVLAFVIIMALASVGSRPPTIVSESEESVAVAEVATAVPLPTETPIPTDEPTTVPTDLPTEIPTLEPTAIEDVQAESVDSSDSSSAYDPSVVAHGSSLFVSCGACHGADGTGITGLGKSLTDSEFMDGLTDDELVDFIKTGRPVWDADNTTGVDMPPRGGNPSLSDDDIFAIVAYIRSISVNTGEESVSDDMSADTSDESASEDSSEDTSEEPVSDDSSEEEDDGGSLVDQFSTLTTGTSDDSASDDSSEDDEGSLVDQFSALTTGTSEDASDDSVSDDSSEDASEETTSDDSSEDASEEPASDDSSADTSEESDSAYDPDVVAYGSTLFISCGACHGSDGSGITGLGKSLTDSEFMDGLSDDELVDFIKTGRPVWDADNTTGVDMPPRGGNPSLSDDDIFAIVAYIRSLSE